MSTVNLDNLAVEVRNVWFNYHKGPKEESLLKDVDMTIPESAIYGLLGPSGCGKTTLLRLIVGTLKPGSGTIRVFNTKPGDVKSIIPGPGVGYMPQDLALYNELTIYESLIYFAKIYGMKKDHTELRMNFLVEFLDLPQTKQMVKHLSGGQKRRVSLASALIHNPPLLILDEPTVGVDPLLREKIWKHLVTLTMNDRMTIIITTHYIEEARNAHIVSLMRHGKLLAEQSPEVLLSHFQVSSLEDVFLKICHHNDENNTIIHNLKYSQKVHVSTDVGSYKTLLSKNENDNKSATFNADVNSNIVIKKSGRLRKSRIGFYKLSALMTKNFIRLQRNIPTLLFNLLLPALQIVLFCLCIGNDPFDLNIAVYNPELRYNGSLSNKLLNHINKDVIKIKYLNSMTAAMESVKDGISWGALVFNESFTKAFISRIQSDPIYNVPDEIIDQSTIKYYADSTNLIIYESISRELYDANLKFIDELLKNVKYSSLNPKAASPMIQLQQPSVYGDTRPNFREFMAPGILLGIIYLLAVGLTAISFVNEKSEGLFERTLIAGAKEYEILLSHALIQFIIIMIQTFLMLMFLFLIFNITNKGLLIWVILLAILQGSAGMCFGLLVSTLCSDVHTALMMSLGSFYPNMILSGIIWPLESMPKVLRYFSYFLPQTLSVISIRDIMLRGWGFEHYTVYLGFISTFVWIILFLFIASIVATFIDKKF